MITLVAVLLVAGGILSVLRSVVIIATRGHGLFPADPWVGLILGWAACLSGQALLN